jgi:nucleotide-binding universal stress UspA family protein
MTLPPLDQPMQTTLTDPLATHVMFSAAKPLLFAFFDGDLPSGSLQRAAALAGILGARLHVVRVLDRPWPFSPPSAEGDLLATLRSAEQAVMRASRDWQDLMAEAALEDLTPDELQTRSGDFVRQVATHAAEIDAGFIVMPPSERRSGGLAAQLACATLRPVLVARDVSSAPRIIAATDLRDSAYPVLRMAMALGERLKAAIIALHNVSPLSFGNAAVPASSAVSSACRRALTEAGREHLDRAIQLLPGPATPRVAEQVDPVAAILQEARAQDAGLIIVGTRSRSWLLRLLLGSLAARVVNQARRSVLVVPLERAAGARV